MPPLSGRFANLCCPVWPRQRSSTTQGTGTGAPGLPSPIPVSRQPRSLFLPVSHTARATLRPSPGSSASPTPAAAPVPRCSGAADEDEALSRSRCRLRQMHPSRVSQRTVSCELAEEKLRSKDKTSPLLLAQTSAPTLRCQSEESLVTAVLKVFALDVAEAF